MKSVFHSDGDDGPSRADDFATDRIKIVEHGCTFVCARRKFHIQLGAFNLRANWNCVALVDLFAGIVADKLHLLGVVVDLFIYDHNIALGRTIFKVRRGVHADVDHALGHFFIQLFCNLFG